MEFIKENLKKAKSDFMGKLGSIGARKKPNVVSIGMKSITPAQKIKFHRQRAVASLKKNDFSAYRYHSREVAKINTGLVISRMRKAPSKKYIKPSKRKYTKTGKYSKFVMDEFGDKELSINERMKILKKVR